MISKFVTKTVEITDAYKKINVNAKDVFVKIEPSNDNRTKIFLSQDEKRPYEFFVKDEALTINFTNREWYNVFSIGIKRSEIKLCVPESMLESVSVKSKAGRVDISSIICSGAISIQLNAGQINLENVTCREFSSKGSTGAVALNKFIANEKISIKQKAGKVLLNDCTAPEIFVEINTGAVCGRLPSNMMYVVRTNTGKVEIPKAPIGEATVGKCEIKTNTGNVKFE